MFRAASDRHMSVNSAIITINELGAIQSVDKGACQMFGYELEELMGQKVNKLLPTPYREQHDAYLQNYHNTGRKRIIGMSRLVEGQHKDGSIFPIRLAVSEVQMGSSKMFIGMIDRVEDTAGTVTANNEGTIISCNKQCEAIWGYSVSELVGKNLAVLMPSPHREHHDTYIANYRRTGTMKVINHTRNVPARHKNGTVFPVSLQVTKLKVGVVELFKGRVEKVDTEMEAVFTLDKRGVIVSCNRNFVAPLFGYTDTELIGKHIRVLVPSLTKDSKGKVNEGIQIPSTSSGGGEGGSSPNSDSASSNRGSRKRKRSAPRNGSEGEPGGSTDEEKASGGGNGLETEHSIETQANELQNEMSAHALRERKGKDKEKEDGGGDNESEGQANEDEDDAQAEAWTAQARKEEQEPSMESSWSLSGRRRLQVRHKDGSVFPVDFSISKFTKDDTVLYSGRIRRVDETDTSMTEGEESSGHTQQDNNLVGDYIVEGNVGQGSYGKVKLAYHRTTRHQVAIKILQKDLMDSAELERSRREITIQRKLLHPNIARLYDVIESEDRINIVMEYSEGGELLTYITKQAKLSETEARRLFLQLISAVQYCHSLNIIHRDIKHKNILLDGAKNIKLIDFGLSNYSQAGALRSTFCGTPAYAAPEMILAKKYVGPEVDVWSMGVVLFTMVAGRFPFGNVSHIIDGQYTLPETISPVLADLIRKMLTVDTDKRISVNEINMHPWVALGGKELPPLRPYSSHSSSGLTFGTEPPLVMANTGEWSHHSTPASMLAQDHPGSHYGGGVTKPNVGTNPPIYLRSHYASAAYGGGGGGEPATGQSSHAQPVRILPKTPPQQSVPEYVPASYATDGPAIGMHPIGGMHGMPAPILLPGMHPGVVSPPPLQPQQQQYYGYAPATTTAVAGLHRHHHHHQQQQQTQQTQTGHEEAINGEGKRRKTAYMGSNQVPPAQAGVAPQYFRSGAAEVAAVGGGGGVTTTSTAGAAGRGPGNGVGSVKDVSCSIISTVTDGSEAEGSSERA